MSETLNTTTPADQATDENPVRWRPVGRVERRVLGVLIEKAKTTPDQYPMTLNGLVTGCNQKSNRDPQMQLDEDSVMESLDRLKAIGAVSEVQGSGRVPKFRHLLYEWLGVDKVELAVMAELLLRGAQTEGELRGRASRMEQIADLTTMRAIFESLRGKRLVQELTPAGRGQIVSHSLYLPDEQERLVQRYGASGSRGDAPPTRSMPPSAAPAAVAPAAVAATPMANVNNAAAEELSRLRVEVAELRRELESLADQVQQQATQISDLRTALGG